MADAARQNWEYLTVTFATAPIRPMEAVELRRLGFEGWELVTVVSTQGSGLDPGNWAHGGFTRSHDYIFKRPLLGGEEPLAQIGAGSALEVASGSVGPLDAVEYETLELAKAGGRFDVRFHATLSSPRTGRRIYAELKGTQEMDRFVMQLLAEGWERLPGGVQTSSQWFRRPIRPELSAGALR